MTHPGHLQGVWPTGCPLPAEDPAKLRGPELGYALYHDKYAERNGEPGMVVVKVLARSYVWSPGECRSNGGHRLYDSKVIERGPGGYKRVVVNDRDLSPLASGTYAVIDPAEKAYQLRTAEDYGR